MTTQQGNLSPRHGKHVDEQALVALLNRTPKHPEALCALAGIYLDSNRAIQAIALLQRALQLAPRAVEIINALGCAYQQSGKINQAEQIFRQGLQLVPDHPALHYNLGSALTTLGKFDEAIAHYQRASELNPARRTQAAAAIASALEKSGRIEEAFARIAPFVGTGDIDFPVVKTLAEMAVQHDRLREHVGYCIATISELLAAGKIAAKELATAHFCLGTLHMQQGAAEEAFRQFRAAHDNSVQAYDRDDYDRQISKLTVNFGAAQPAAATACTKKFTPVFITGMARSGTSLLEQMLSTSPLVTSLGESGLFHRLVCEMLSDPDVQWGSAPLPHAQCASLASLFRQRLLLEYPPKPYVTDKSLENIFLVGQILQVFPNARVILTRRDPRDTCVSCFTHNFAGRHDYSHRLEDLAHYANHVNRLTDFWAEKFKDNVTVARYEEIVGNPEKEIRRIVGFCGLEWSEDFLEFHSRKRVVITSSYNQVTQKIHSSSVQRWKIFEPYLGDLLANLDMPADYDTGQ